MYIVHCILHTYTYTCMLALHTILVCAVYLFVYVCGVWLLWPIVHVGVGHFITFVLE